MKSSSIPSSAGFTLIELLISLTILSLLVTVLYQSFATASRVWSRQELFDETKARQVSVRRLLNADFGQNVMYRYSHPQGQYTFFAGTSTVLFYVTTNGFGARNRNDFGLFFTCCYLWQNNDGSQTVKLYKSAYPEKFLLEIFERFMQLSSSEQKVWQVPTELDEQSLVVLSDVEQGVFLYQQQDKENFEIPSNTEYEPFTMWDTEPWQLQETLPELFRFTYQLNQKWTHQQILLGPVIDSTNESKKNSEVK